MITLQEALDRLTEALDSNPPDTPVVLDDDFEGDGGYLSLPFLFGLGTFEEEDP